MTTDQDPVLNLLLNLDAESSDQESAHALHSTGTEQPNHNELDDLDTEFTEPEETDQTLEIADTASAQALAAPEAEERELLNLLGFSRSQRRRLAREDELDDELGNPAKPEKFRMNARESVDIDGAYAVDPELAACIFEAQPIPENIAPDRILEIMRILGGRLEGRSEEAERLSALNEQFSLRVAGLNQAVFQRDAEAWASKEKTETEQRKDPIFADSNCGGDVERDIFFSAGKQSIEAAKIICRDCVAQVDCFNMALTDSSTVGVFAGTDAAARSKIRKLMLKAENSGDQAELDHYRSEEFIRDYIGSSITRAAASFMRRDGREQLAAIYWKYDIPNPEERARDA